MLSGVPIFDQMPSGNPFGPATPPVELAPGWYWCAFSEWDLLSWRMVQRESVGRILTKQEWQAEPDKGTAATALFEVRGGSFTWRMRPLPSVAPRGEQTTWLDMYKDAPRPEPGILERVENVATEAAETVKSAASVLLWGAVAIGLFAVYRATR